jgi:hypothetical protein
MNSYVKAVLGGFLAILAAFGWAVAIAFMLILKGVVSVVGIYKGAALWVLLVMIFSVGFYLSFRAAYSKKSN